MIDIHSHIIPGIDDGSTSFTESLDIIRELQSYGITDIIATPHYVDETNYVSPKKNNQKILDELKERLKQENIQVNVYLGNEIYINDRIGDLINAGEISTMAGSKYILVELPLDNEYPNYQEYLKELIVNDYKVILAHPERYLIIQDDYSIIDELIDMGVLLQCNLGSITGKYGNLAKKTVKRIIKEKKAFAFGSDIHHGGRGAYVQKALKKLAKYYDEKELRKVLISNSKKIIT